MEQAITTIILFMGIVTVVLSLVVAKNFYDHQKTMTGGASKLGSAISWQLAGESVIGIGTLAFATAAHVGWLKSWSTETQSALRFVMFFATSVTTVHLKLTLSRIRNG